MRKHGLSGRKRLAHLTELEHLTEDRAVFAHIEDLHLLQHSVLQHPVDCQNAGMACQISKAGAGMT